jgi:3-dehydroquinate dehydratase/shikimate dehydrogenase
MDWIVSLTPEVSDDPLEAISQPPDGASIVELRVDLFPGLDVRTAISACPLPVLVTLRSEAEGGKGTVEGGERRESLEAARYAGAALIDLEYERDRDLVRDLGLAPEQVVLSWHDVSGTPDDLADTAARMFQSPARWIKVIPSVNSLADLEAVLALHQQFNASARRDRRLLTFGMGTAGIASRYLAPLLGPPLSYAAWSAGAEAAPGQLTIVQTESIISHLNGPPQKVYGVVGRDVSRSLSPVLHSAGYRDLGLPFVFLPVSVSDPLELSKLFAPQGETCFDRVGLAARGWAVTTPYKAEAAAAADLHAPRVVRAGAANTMILNSQQVVAENTDADGIVGSLVSLGIEPMGLRAVVQGTGGAARGAAVGLYLAGAEVTVRSRSGERAHEAAELIDVDWCEPGDCPDDAAILVNATPLGGETGDQPPFADREIEQATAVVDMVYADHTTDLIERATEAGAAVADGRDVLLHQGLAQFAAFTQRVPPRDAMRKALKH